MAKTLKLVEANIFGIVSAEERKAKEDSAEKGLYSEAEEPIDIENSEDTVDEVIDDIQDETPTEDEEEISALDTQLNELREILPDLDLRLYQVTNKEDTNKVFYFIGKVAENSDDVLMLVDTNPEAEEISEVPVEEGSLKEAAFEAIEDGEETEEPENFDFQVIPNSYDELAKLNPRYGEDLTPDHEKIMEYLMNCLVKKNPDRAEELQAEKAPEDLEEPETSEEI